MKTDKERKALAKEISKCEDWKHWAVEKRLKKKQKEKEKKET